MARPKKKLTESDLVNIIDSELSHAKSYNNNVQVERRDALRSFYGEKYGNETDFRSKIVTREVQETVLWALPLIMKLFSDDGIIRFEPSRPGREDQAKQKTAFVKYILSRKNNEFYLQAMWFLDALLQKNSVIKVWYDKNKQKKKRVLKGITADQLAMLESDESIEVLDTEEEKVSQSSLDPFTGMPLITFKVTILQTLTKNGTIKPELVPPEEVVVSKKARSVILDESPFVAHRVKRTLSYLRKQGYKGVTDDLTDEGPVTEFDNLKMTRNAEDGTFEDYGQETTSADPSSREVWVTECFMYVDFDGDGVQECRQIVKVGKKVFKNEEIVTMPFAAVCPIPMPHKYYGLSMADQVVDQQLHKTMLMRAINDSFLASLSPKRFVNHNIVSMDDLLDDDPSAVVRVDGDVNAAVKESVTNSVAPEAFEIVKYLDDQIESRTGVSKYTQGINAEDMHATASGASMVMNASQAKIALIAKLFAETGVKTLYKKIVQLASEYYEEPEMILIDGQFIEVDPREWDDSDHIVVDVGIGSLDRTDKLNGLRELYTAQKEMLQMPMPEGQAFVQIQNIYAVMSRLAETLGFKAPSDFFNDPAQEAFMAKFQQITSQPPPPDPNMELAKAETMKAQNAAQKVQQDMFLEQRKQDIEAKKIEIENELKRRDIEMKYELELTKLSSENFSTLLEELKAEADALGGGLNDMPKPLPGQLDLLRQLMRDPEANGSAERRHTDVMAGLAQLNQAFNKPRRTIKQINRDPNGKAVSVEEIEVPTDFPGVE